MKVHYRVHKSLPQTPILSHINLVQNPMPYFFNVHYVNDLTSTPNFLK